MTPCGSKKGVFIFCHPFRRVEFSNILSLRADVRTLSDCVRTHEILLVATETYNRPVLLFQRRQESISRLVPFESFGRNTSVARRRKYFAESSEQSIYRYFAEGYCIRHRSAMYAPLQIYPLPFAKGRYRGISPPLFPTPVLLPKDDRES